MEGAPLPSKPDFRGFFHRLLSHEPTQRRVFLKLWHSPYPIVPKRHARLADVFVEFIGDILYEAVEFKLRQDHFCLFGRGKQGLGFQLRWLKKKQRDFLVYSVFAHRHALFKSIKRFENNQFDLSGFVHDPQQQQKEHPYERICDPMWQRELVRDFVWLVISKREGHMTLELIAALQEMMLSHPMGRKDIFLASLHAGLQGHCNVREVLCWGNETYDVHSEEDWQKRIQPPPGQMY